MSSKLKISPDKKILHTPLKDSRITSWSNSLFELLLLLSVGFRYPLLPALRQISKGVWGNLRHARKPVSIESK